MAHAKLLRAGRSIATADVEIVDLDGKVIAVGRGTYSTA
jgi:acyl-coenzyme A thioesterase PaaI-like protein